MDPSLPSADAGPVDKTGGPKGQLAVHPAAGQFLLDNAACDDRPAGINALDLVLNHMVRNPLHGGLLCH